MMNTLLTLQREAMMTPVAFSPPNIRRETSNRFATSASSQPPLNADGVPSQSPGLRGTSYPGLNPINRSQPQRGCGQRIASSRHNPVGVAPSARRFPKVARPSQPWAEGHNPVGIDSSRAAFSFTPATRCAHHPASSKSQGLKARDVIAWAGEPQARRPRFATH